MTDATMPSTPPRDAEDGFDEREMVVASLIRELGSLSPSGRFRDKRLIHRFAATRDYNRDATAKLLHEYARYRRARGLEDDSLRNNPGVSREMRKRHTMRLLDPRLGPATSDSAQRLTFLQLHTPSMWPTARDKDGCPVVYTNVEQYACRGASSRAVEQTFVWILETVCNELGRRDSATTAAASPSFSISPDAPTSTFPPSVSSERFSSARSSADFEAASTGSTSTPPAGEDASYSESSSRSWASTPRPRSR